MQQFSAPNPDIHPLSYQALRLINYRGKKKNSPLPSHRDACFREAGRKPLLNSASNPTSGAVVKVSSLCLRPATGFRLPLAGGRQLQKSVSLKMADEEAGGAERMEISAELPQTPQRLACVSPYRQVSFVLPPVPPYCA